MKVAPHLQCNFDMNISFLRVISLVSQLDAAISVIRVVPYYTVNQILLFWKKMSNEDRKRRLSALKFMELAFCIGCLVLHYYSFNDIDVITTFITTGSYIGYIIIIFGMFAGSLMKTPIHRRLDMLFSLIGCGLFVASGVLLIELWEHSFRTRTRDFAILKAALSIVNGVMFAFDAIFTFRDK